VSSYLVNFASKRDPDSADLVSWPKIDQNQPQTMELGVRLGPVPLADREKLDFWTRYYNSPISRNMSF
jgi:para-nitrobenzyl esterase